MSDFANHKFLSAEPFPHLVADNFMPPDVLRACEKEFDAIDPDLWHRYSSPDEQGKAAFNDFTKMPPACRSVFSMLTHETVAKLCEMITGIEGLNADSSLYGGGLHNTSRDGFLGLHIDNERHPNTGHARRLNLIVYCTSDWQECWGGHLELWDRARRRAVQKIAPLFNRAVLFETCAYSFHGHTQPLKCPKGISRKSLAVYYWSEPRARARFMAAADERFDWQREELRVARSLAANVLNAHQQQRAR